MTRFTKWNTNRQCYETEGNEFHGFSVRQEIQEVIPLNEIISSIKPTVYLSGDVIDRLAEYENIGMTPEEYKNKVLESTKEIHRQNEINRKAILELRELETERRKIHNVMDEIKKECDYNKYMY